MAIYTVGADSLEGKYNGDIDGLKHASGNTAVGKSLSNTRDTLLGGEASCAYLVVVLRDRLNQVLWRMMDEPCGFMRNENRSIHWGPLALCRSAVLMSVEVRKYTECWQIDSCSVRVICKRVHHTPKTTFFDIFGGWCTCLEIWVDAECDGGVAE